MGPGWRIHCFLCMRLAGDAYSAGDDINSDVVATREERDPFMLRRPPHDQGDDLKSDVVAPRATCEGAGGSTGRQALKATT